MPVSAHDGAAFEPTPRYVLRPSESVGGELAVPGDKSISHRALMLGAVATGPTRIRGLLRGDDCLATLAAVEALGVDIRVAGDGTVEMPGTGFDGLSPPTSPLDLGNSGTAIRLLAGLLAGAGIDCELTGDESLRSRPMERIAAPLRQMGARIDTTGGRAPIRISGGRRLHGIDYALPLASAQIKSALLLAALSADGTTRLESPGPSRDHTERMLRAMGVAVTQRDDGNRVELDGPADVLGAEIDVPGDFSSAAFFVVAGCLGAGHGLLIRNVGINPTRTGLLTVLRQMGADVSLQNERVLGAEPVADLHVARSRLRGVDVPPELVPLMIDEFPVLFVAAAGAEGTTVVRGADELRHKESDRLSVMARALAAVGGVVEERPDGLSITGGRLHGGCIDSAGDHRIAMSMSIASLISEGDIEVLNTRQVATSFPGFCGLARTAGLAIESPGDDVA